MEKAKKRKKPKKSPDVKIVKNNSDTNFKRIRVIGVVLLVIITSLSFIMLAYADFYWETNNRSTISTFYVDRLTYDPEQNYFIEVNYFSNELRNGEQVLEIRFNYYTDANTPDTNNPDSFKNVYSTGIQFMGTPRFSLGDYRLGGTGFLGLTDILQRRNHFAGNRGTNYFFYNTTNGISYNAINNLEMIENWIVDFDGVVGKLVSRGDILMREAFLQRMYRHWNHIDMIEAMYNSIRNFENGINVLQFDMSRFFTGRQIVNGQFAPPNSDLSWLFVNVKVNRSSNGMITSNQSLFGRVRDNHSWAHSTQGTPSDFWQSRTVVELTVRDFEFISTGVGANFFGVLRADAVVFLRSFNNLDIVININLNAPLPIGEGIFNGLGVNPFGVLNIKEINIRSNTQTVFYLPYAIPNINATNVTLVVIGGG